MSAIKYDLFGILLCPCRASYALIYIVKTKNLLICNKESASNLQCMCVSQILRLNLEEFRSSYLQLNALHLYDNI